MAVTVHDPAGRMLAGVERDLEALGGVFAGVAVAGTDATDGRIFDALGGLSCVSSRHAADGGRIGWARRESVRLAIDAGAPAVLYSDLDHVLRWVEADRGELELCLAAQPGTDLLVVGRSDAAFASSPARLQETERLVNHVYGLITGRTWDLMFAIRRLSGGAARAIVEQCSEDSLANDVTWPLLAEALGFSVGYFAADGLSYLTTSDFDEDRDRRDGDPASWIHRIEIAAGHARAMVRFLPTGPGRRAGADRGRQGPRSPR